MANTISLAKRTRGNYAGKCIVFNGTEFQLYFAQEKELDTTNVTGVERIFLNSGSRRYKGDPMKVTVTYTYNLLTKGGQEGLLEDAKAWFKQFKDTKDWKKVQEALNNAEAEGKIEKFELDTKFKIYSLYDVQPMVESKDIAKTDDGKVLCITKDGTIGTRDKLPLGTEMLPLYMVRSIMDSTSEAAKDLPIVSYGEKFIAWQKGTWEPPKQAVGVNSFESLLASFRQIPAQQVAPEGVAIPF
ncbi:MAG: hypothetical protein II063_10450 [Prevotella sp.]|nr:hypothetical protein [Prevotella sp.]